MRFNARQRGESTASEWLVGLEIKTAGVANGNVNMEAFAPVKGKENRDSHRGALDVLRANNCAKHRDKSISRLCFCQVSRHQVERYFDDWNIKKRSSDET